MTRTGLKQSEHKEATRLVAGKVQWTGANDAEGIPVELTAYDYERLSREEIGRYQERREQRKAAVSAQAAEAADLERFTARFVAAGGKKSEAPAAFQAHRKHQAAEAAARAEDEAILASRRRIREVL